MIEQVIFQEEEIKEYRPGATDEYFHPIFTTSADPFFMKIGVWQLWNEWSAVPYPVGPGAGGGSHPPFWGTNSPHNYYSRKFGGSKPMGWRLQKYHSLPNMAVGSPGQLGANPPFWGVNLPHNHYSRKIGGSKPMGWRLQKCHSLPNMAVGSLSQLWS